MQASEITITLFAKSGGPLTKRISLNEDGSLVSDGSACVMAHGTARRVSIIGAGQRDATRRRRHARPNGWILVRANLGAAAVADGCESHPPLY